MRFDFKTLLHYCYNVARIIWRSQCNSLFEGDGVKTRYGVVESLRLAIMADMHSCGKKWT